MNTAAESQDVTYVSKFVGVLFQRIIMPILKFTCFNRANEVHFHEQKMLRCQKYEHKVPHFQHSQTKYLDKTHPHTSICRRSMLESYYKVRSALRIS